MLLYYCNFEGGKIFRHLEDLSFLMEAEGVWEGLRIFLFKLPKAFAGRVDLFGFGPDDYAMAKDSRYN